MSSHYQTAPLNSMLEVKEDNMGIKTLFLIHSAWASSLHLVQIDFMVIWDKGNRYFSKVYQLSI